MSRAAVLLAVAVLGAAAGIAVALAVATSPVLVHPVHNGVLRGLIVASTVALGCYLAHRRPESRFGILLAANGFLFALTALTAAADPAVFTLGRIANLLLWLSLAYLFVSFPGDTVPPGRNRRVLLGVAVASGVAWAANVAVSPRLPPGGHFVNCDGPCPENGLRIITAPDLVADVVRLGATACGVALLAAVALLLVLRMRHSVALERWVVAVPLTLMTFAAIVTAASTVLRESGASQDLVYRVGGVGRVTALLLPFGFIAGLIMGRVFVTETTRRLIGELSEGTHSPAEARAKLARVLEQPSLRLAFWLPEHNHYADTEGGTIPASLDVPGRTVTALQRDGQPYAVVVHESALPEERAVLELVGPSSILAFENMRLQAQLIASTGDLRASRARIVAIADGERRRVERDLHDGAQHRLIALRVKLRLLEEDGESDPIARAELVRELEADAEAALDDLRSLVRGIYPPLLVDRGLRAALSWAIRNASIRTSLDADGLRRYAPEVEAAVYFCCVEALQNAAKHAAGATRVTITLREADGCLAFEVSDDGAGFRRSGSAPSGGLTNMCDRVGAAGGSVEISSVPGSGTRVHGAVPIPSPARTS